MFPEIDKKVLSVSLDKEGSCVNLYITYRCEGVFTRILEGSDVANDLQKHQLWLTFNEEVSSLSPCFSYCNDGPLEQQLINQGDPEVQIQLFEHAGYRGNAFFFQITFQ